jgi:hypothetical protein
LTYVPIVWAVGSGIFGFVFAGGVWYATTSTSISAADRGLSELAKAVREEGVRRDEIRRELLNAVQKNSDFFRTIEDKVALVTTDAKVLATKQDATNQRLDNITELLKDAMRSNSIGTGTTRPKR